MNPASWKWIVALAFGSAIGVAIRHGLFLLFGHSERAISVSTVTASSILGGFSGAAIGYVMAAPGLSQELRTLFMFGLLGTMVTAAADATAVQASLSVEDAARGRRRLGIHLVFGAAAALLGIGIVTSIVRVFS